MTDENIIKIIGSPRQAADDRPSFRLVAPPRQAADDQPSFRLVAPPRQAADDRPPLTGKDFRLATLRAAIRDLESFTLRYRGDFPDTCEALRPIIERLKTRET